jgi:hypothetical protein
MRDREGDDGIIDRLNRLRVRRCSLTAGLIRKNSLLFSVP